MSYFVEVQAVRSEVGSLVHEAAIFRSDTEVLDDIEIDAATVRPNDPKVFTAFCV